MAEQPIQEQPPIQQLKAVIDSKMPGWWELSTNHDGTEYLTLPVGHNKALEVDASTDTDDMPAFVVSYRSWDMTGGMMDDEIIFMVHIKQVFVTASFLTHYINNLMSDDD